MRLAYVTTYDSANVAAWSGLGSYMRRALQDGGFRVVPVGDLKERYRRLTDAKARLYAKLLSRRYRPDREPIVLRSYAAQVARALATTECDVVFSPGTIPIAYLRTDRPIVFWTDATFAGMIDFYPNGRNLCRESIRNGNRMEQAALSRCRLALYSSEWAAGTAIRHYDVDPAKVKVVPFGANVEGERDADEIRAIVAGRRTDVCRLLFVGVKWQRKGGDIALEVADRLNRNGLPTELHVVGCTPPDADRDFVTVHGFVSKATEEGRRTLDRLFAGSHFLILPSRADCSPVVVAEASSFGLPSITTDVGGIPTMVRDDVNGRLFRPGTEIDDYCDYIAGLMARRDDYDRLALSSFREYAERLNWTVAGATVRDLIHEHCG